MPSEWNVLSLVKAAAEVIAKSGSPSARLDADLLLADILGWDRLKLYTRFDMPVGDDERGRYRAAVRRRIGGEPLAYILGRKEFLGRTFAVTRDVLVPRPETEFVVEAALEAAKARGAPARVLEIGVGSGCIILSIAAELGSVGHAGTDVSAAALAIARRNAATLGLAAAVDLLEGDTFAPLEDALVFDVIVSNPPYIRRDEAASLPKDVRDFEPELALYSPADGLHFHREILSKGRSRLASGGAVVLELPGYGGAELVAFVERQGFAGESEVVRDLAGAERVFVQRKK